MVRSRLLFVSVILLAAFLPRMAAAEILIGVAGPMTGKLAWFGEQMERGAALAVADLNAAGGVLGEQVELITVDDYCDAAQAVAAARKLVSDGVIFVAGHYCSGASIPASEIYEAAGVLQISPSSSNPKLTELGRANVFRVRNRDDAVGAVVGNFLADHWADKKIAILHDNTVFGKDSAEVTKKQLNRRGVTEAIYQVYVPGKNNYGAEIDQLQAAGIEVAFIGGYHPEIGLMARAARDRGYPVQLVVGQNLTSEDFPSLPAPPPKERSSSIVRTRAEMPKRRPSSSGSERTVSNQRADTMFAYAAVQVWAQAAEKAGSLELDAMIASLRQNQFDTVLGPIEFDDKGDPTVQNLVWYVWRGGTHAPLEQAEAER